MTKSGLIKQDSEGKIKIDKFKIISKRKLQNKIKIKMKHMLQVKSAKNNL